MLLRIPHGARILASDLPNMTAPALLAVYANPAVTCRLKAEMLATVIICDVRRSLESPDTRFCSVLLPLAQPLLLLPSSRRCRKAPLTLMMADVLVSQVGFHLSQSLENIFCRSCILSALSSSVCVGPVMPALFTRTSM